MISSQYFPRRHPQDQLDVSRHVHAALTDPAERTLLRFRGESWTNHRFASRVARLQEWLAEKGLVQGDRVAVMMGNSPDHVALIYAAMLGGIVWVPINTKLKAAGLQYLRDHSKPRLAVVDASLQQEWDRANEASSHHCPMTSLGSVGDSDAAPRLSNISPFDTLCLIYTSGTTGAPKGVMFTHRMMRAAAEAAILVGDIQDGDRLFLWEPLCHVGGAQMLVVPIFKRVELQMVEAFSASRFWEQIDESRSSHVHYLGGIMDILLTVPRGPEQGKSLRIAWGGGGMNLHNWQPARERIAPVVRECYGMTECSSFGTINASGKPGSVGKALPWITVELVDDDGNEVAVGTHGEIVLSTAVEGVFLAGYLDNPEATRSVLREGKLYTGDFGRRDEDGDLYFIGRKTDSMRVRGENVSAWEIERVLSSNPAVHMVAAVGVKSDIGEQEVIAYVQWNGQPGELQSLYAWAKERLARFQLPRYWTTVERFDLTPSERVRKHLLSRDLAAAWDASASLKNPKAVAQGAAAPQ